MELFWLDFVLTVGNIVVKQVFLKSVIQSFLKFEKQDGTEKLNIRITDVYDLCPSKIFTFGFGKTLRAAITSDWSFWYWTNREDKWKSLNERTKRLMWGKEKEKITWNSRE